LENCFYFKKLIEDLLNRKVSEIKSPFQKGGADVSPCTQWLKAIAVALGNFNSERVFNWSIINNDILHSSQGNDSNTIYSLNHSV
jgi:hypothetical protein